MRQQHSGAIVSSLAPFTKSSELNNFENLHFCIRLNKSSFIWAKMHLFGLQEGEERGHAQSSTNSTQKDPSGNRTHNLHAVRQPG